MNGFMDKISEKGLLPLAMRWGKTATSLLLPGDAFMLSFPLRCLVQS